MSDSPGHSDPASLRNLINHVFLPPKLPQSSEDSGSEHAMHLYACNLLVESMAACQQQMPDQDMSSLIRMLLKVKEVLLAPLAPRHLEEILNSLGNGDIIALHIRAQNAAIIVHVKDGDATFDIFEVSFPSEDVMASEDRLLCAFPTHSVVVPSHVFLSTSFKRNLSTFLSAMDRDELDSTPTITKAGSKVQEVRDTADPRYITELLVGILHGLDGASPGTVSRITKRIADEVLWHNAYKPWRRSPLYLILRVTMQLFLPAQVYKCLMAHFMSKLLDASVDDGGFSSDLLQVMRAKLARRVAKIGSNVLDFIITSAHAAVQRAGVVLEGRWHAAQVAQSQAAPWNPPSDDDLRQSTILSLENSGSYIRAVLNRQLESAEETPTIPTHPIRLQDIQDFRHYSEGRLINSVDNDNPIVALCDFEQSVLNFLGQWVSGKIRESGGCHDACRILLSCFEQYISAADAHYSSTNLLDQSLKYITILMIWVGIDRLTVADHCLLADYCPPIPSTFLEPLLLRDNQTIRAAAFIERYLQTRCTEATESLPILSDSTEPSSFAIRYYNQSPAHQDLRRAIEEKAQSDRAKTLARLNRLEAERTDLMARASQMSHEFHTQTIRRRNREKTEKIHADDCARCKLEKKASRLYIQVHEWPLPASDNDAKRVVFEASCPQSFSIWREATFTIVFDMGLPESLRTDPADFKMTLVDYPGLRKFHSARRSRIGIASTTKSFVQSHYSAARLPVKEESVLVNNGLTFRLFDSKGPVWAARSFEAASLVHHFTTVLPVDSKYKHLQWALNGTEHTSNSVLADQSSCPNELSIHEHISFGSLRAGGRLQWLNIARELRARTLSFDASEVHFLLTQAMWQAGPLQSNVLEREWHVELLDATFCRVLLQESRALIRSISGNWEQSLCLRTIILLLLRVAETAQDQHILHDLYDLLRFARETALSLTSKLLVKVSRPGTTLFPEVRRRICEMAATVCSTFDISDQHLYELLFSDADVCALVRCAILVQENMPPDNETLPLDMQYLLNCHWRLLHKVESRLRAHPQRAVGFDRALSSLWTAFPPTLSWQAMSFPNQREMFCLIPLSGVGPRLISLNLLNGSLLIDGKPLGRLPRTITSHSTFTRLFPREILEVIPATDPGMEYETRVAISDHIVSFALRGMETTPDLIIRACRYVDGKKVSELELIPHEKLRGDFPSLLVEDYIHWIDIKTGEMEFRPLETAWESNAQNWHMRFQQKRAVLQLVKNQSSTLLVDINSAVFGSVCACLAVLEHTQFIHAVIQDDRLFAALPRLKLSFFMNSEGQLESTNIRDMVVDSDQCPKTFIGLKSQLVLRGKAATVFHLPRTRHIIVPDGVPRFLANGINHVHVIVDVPTSSRQVSHHGYTVNEDLCCLTGDVSIRSHFYKCYLHALTSGALPDPLTGHTGTEESLRGLSSGRAFSFQRLLAEDLSLLGDIAMLSPKRNYYPSHLRVMEDVTWSSLHFLAQHDGFRGAVAAILSFARSLAVFPSSHTNEMTAYDINNFHDGDPRLTARALHHHFSFYDFSTPCTWPAQNSTKSIFYVPSRELGRTSQGLQPRASVHSVAIFCSRLQLPASSLAYCSHKILSLLEAWKFIGFNSDVRLSYSRYWAEKPELGRVWLSLCQRCLAFDDEQFGGNRYELIFSLSSLFYGDPGKEDAALILVACALNQPLRSVSPLHDFSCDTLFDLDVGYEPKLPLVQSEVHARAFDLARSPASFIAPLENESTKKFRRRTNKYYQENVSLSVSKIASAIFHSWPQSLSIDTFATLDPSITEWIDVADAIAGIERYFQRCRENTSLQSYILELQTALEIRRSLSFTLPLISIDYRYDRTQHQSHEPILVLTQLLSTRHHPGTISFLSRIAIRVSSQNPGTANGPGTQVSLQNTDSTDHLSDLIIDLEENQSNSLSRAFGRSLSISREHSQNFLTRRSTSSSFSVEDLQCRRDICRSTMECALVAIQEALSPSSATEQLVKSAGLWPCITSRSILELLRFGIRQMIKSQRWTSVLGAFSRIMIQYQRSQRLIEFFVHGKVEEFAQELENEVTDDLEDLLSDQFDWLLIQIESNMLTRPLQRAVAKEMISPASNGNTLYQLNMGEGKSSVIIPLASVTLADGHTLVRVVVLKALSSQMFDLLVARITGLTNRRVFYLPFSRNIRITTQILAEIRAIYEECVKTGGVLVTQPEHVLSFKLMGLDHLVSQPQPLFNHSLARELWDCHQWIDGCSRDLLDESDELLHSRYQLIYTVGSQQAVEGNTCRWSTIQQVLHVVKTCVAKVLGDYPDDIQYDMRSTSSFPIIRLLSHKLDSLLSDSIASYIMSGALPNLNFSIFSSDVRRSIRAFILSENLTEDMMSIVEDACGTGTDIWTGTLLLRGLLSPRFSILLYALKERRWRVDFGLDLSRTMLAVPYRAKDVPSDRAEFGHPDVAIVLTCLSYYYGGLTKDQVIQSFELLYKLDNPIEEYGRWAAAGGNDVEQTIRHFSGVNMADEDLVDRILVPKFRLNYVVIDFFLQQAVFPRYAKEFPHKLGTSGWDLAARKPKPTTGFSGTRDNRFLLPTSIEQSDSLTAEQQSTDALVLSYLLQPENSYHALTHQPNGEEYLEFIGAQDSIRVLLDVGAQMLDLENEDLAHRWLDRAPLNVTAAIFFTDTDDLAVRTRDGTVELLKSSPYSDRLEECVVYLDDAHTRGTDLKLPRDTRAALTLGPRVTKDRIVQGAMRMRKLGHGQSILIIAPPEIDRAIRSVGCVPAHKAVKMIDVVRWAIHETCEDIVRYVPHWLEQGLDFKARQEAYLAYDQSSNMQDLKEGCLRPEAKPLKKLYGHEASRLERVELRDGIHRDPDLVARLSHVGVRFVESRLSEEQVREVNHEIEGEHEVRRPPKTVALPHTLHPDIALFASSGHIPAGSFQFKRFFRPIQGSSTLENSVHPILLSTVDFMSTVSDVGPSALHEYMRPVSWVLTTIEGSATPEIAAVISPFEANELLPMIRQGGAKVRLHIYSPRLVFDMAPISDLRFFSLPSSPRPSWRLHVDVRAQLGLWAGQLFLDDYETYKGLCRHLGLYMGCTRDEIAVLQAGGFIQPDGFVKAKGREIAAMDSSFERSPVTRLRLLFGLRRKGVPYTQTHMGRILDARELSLEDFGQ